MRKTLLAFACFFLIASERTLAQMFDIPALQHCFDFAPTDTNKVILDFYNQNFCKDSEYFGPITHGMTLFGSDINAQIGWIPDKHVLLLGGIYLRKDYGNPNFEIVQPTWTVKLQSNNGFSLLFGNLESCTDHRYIEPLYECYFPLTYYYEQYQNPLENGIQFKVDKSWLWVDLWINWAHQEYLASTYHEHITQGLSSELTLLRSSNEKFTITLPVQYTAFHFGGQLDSAHTPYVTLFNGATGLCFNWDFSKSNSFISQVKSENYGCLFNDLSNNGTNDLHVYPYTKGNGLYFNLLVKSKYGFGIMASYWSGTDWAAPLGGDLYQSVSWVYRNFSEDGRNLAFLNLFYQKELFPNLFVDVRLQPYYDLKQNITEYAYFIFATYKRTFTLTKVHLPKFDDGAYSH
jgi:hypothetical protein